MSQNPNEHRDDAVEPTDPTQQLEAATERDDTEPDDTQVLGSGDTQVLTPEPAGPDDPLSIFDQPAATTEYPTTEYPSTAAYTAASYGAGSYGSGSYGAASYEAPSSGPAPQTPPAPGYQTPAPSYTTPSYATPPSPGYEPAAWTAPPKPLVKTTPRTSTIVWGFIILAIGVGALSVAAGATLDVGLAMIWLLAAAGTVLVVASILGAVRRRNRQESTARA
ncbi:hypothetical protein [Xylanimonas cellulosilytica]|nr:hypothetical protein [Xylanimonas cellulosilytica]